jgi:tetratricopeptide (TPR) repeat protein
MKRFGQGASRAVIFLTFFLFASTVVLAQGNKLQVKCVDPSDKPLLGVKVVLEEMKTNKMTEGKTDRNGVAPFKDLADGIYRVVGRQTGYAPTYQERIQLKGGAGQTVTLKFEVGDPAKKLYFEDPAMVAQANDLLKAGFDALQARDFALAEEKLAASLAMVPTNPDTQYYLGVAYFYQNKWDKAQAAMEAAQRLNPQEPRYQQVLAQLPALRLNSEGQQAMDQKNFQEAIAKFSELAKMQPDNADNYYNMSLAYANIGQYDQATEAIEQAMKLKPEEKSYEELKKIIASRKEAAKFDQAKQLADEGDKLYQAKDYVAALEKYKAAEALLPPEAIHAVRIQIGRTHAQLEHVDEAIAAYRQAIELAPNKPEYRRALAGYYYQLGRTAEAMEMYIEYFKQAGTPVDEGLFKIAKQLIGENKQDQATAMLEKIIEINPEHAEAHYELGIIKFYGGDKARAAQLFDAYMKIGKDQEHLADAKALLTVTKQAPPKRPARKRP